MTCVICGKEFAPRNSVQKACSKACSRELNRRHCLKRHYNDNSICHRKPVGCVPKNTLAIRRLNGESLCMWCGNEFATENPLQKFCCDEHKQRFYCQLFS